MMNSKGAKRNITIGADIKHRKYNDVSHGALNLNYYINVKSNEGEW